MAQFNALHEKLVLSRVSHDKEMLEVRFLTILWTVCYGESNDHIFEFFPSE